MILTVNDDHRSQRTGSKAVHRLQRELHVVGRPSRLHPEQPFQLPEDGGRPSHITGRAQANAHEMLPAGCQTERLEKRRHSIDLNGWNAQPLRNPPKRILREIPELILDVLQHRYQLLSSATVRFYYLIYSFKPSLFHLLSPVTSSYPRFFHHTGTEAALEFPDGAGFERLLAGGILGVGDHQPTAALQPSKAVGAHTRGEHVVFRSQAGTRSLIPVGSAESHRILS